MQASELARRLGGEFVGPGDPDVRSIKPLGEANAGDVAFLHNVKYKPQLETTKASCVVSAADCIYEGRKYTAIIHPEPHMAMALAVDILYPELIPEPGVHTSAAVDNSARIGDRVFIGPSVFVGADSEIGAGTIIESGCSIMPDVRIGENCHIYPNVVIYPKTCLGGRCIIHSGTILGSDGFGFAPTNDGILKIRQIGSLVIEDDVEIGANCTIDRGTFTETHIGLGTKLDNLVHIAHNCRIGKYCLIAAQTGLAGSTHLGDRVIVAGQVGFAGHQKIGDNCIFFAKSGINGDIEPGSQLFGYPAKPRLQAHRDNAYVSRLGELFKEVKELAKKISRIEDNQEKR